MNSSPSIVWFRNDLRIADNPALTAAIARGAGVLGLFILDTSAERRGPGEASLWWRRESMTGLADALDRLGVPLLILRGDPAALLPDLAARLGAGAVFWNRRYGGAERHLDSMLKSALRAEGRIVETFNASLLREPWDVRSQAGTPMKVFTPYWRASLALGPFAAPLPVPAPAEMRLVPPAHEAMISAADILTIATTPDWSGGLAAAWQPGEAAARDLLGAFIDGGLRGYAALRDRPDRDHTSRLSPYLAAGDISPRQILHALRFAAAVDDIPPDDVAKFEAEVGARVFLSS
ncbi:MAG: deoxyribodipyrimidine photo-lyase, partial [Proteobacteria bacterium]|nr:deoxyribodipyrimidine photo-lyase [Pseudomonadota bacterium]